VALRKPVAIVKFPVLSHRDLQSIRLRSARKAVEAVPDFNDQGFQSAVGDLVGNLMHYCKVMKVDFQHAVWMGRQHFEDEDEELDWVRLSFWTEKKAR